MMAKKKKTEMAITAHNKANCRQTLCVEALCVR